MPEPLHWFKWEAYTTWLSGFALMVVLYYFDADVRLVDPGVADLDEWQAIALSVGGIALAWIVYDVLCRTVGQRSQAALAVVGTGLVALAAWGASELFAPRAAYLQVGVMLGTIMAANVFFVIIPAHRKLVAAMEEKREPDAAPLLEAKNRSVHNNYLTLPVLFTMLAGHFAFVFGADEAWLVFVAIAVLTALIRVFFNRWHAGRREWWIPAVAAVGVVALAFWLQPDEAGVGRHRAGRVRADPARDRRALRDVSLGRVRAARGPPGDAGADRGADRRHRAPGGAHPGDAARQRDRDDRRRARAPRRMDRAVAVAPSRSHVPAAAHALHRGPSRARAPRRARPYTSTRPGAHRDMPSCGTSFRCPLRGARPTQRFCFVLVLDAR